MSIEICSEILSAPCDDFYEFNVVINASIRTEINLFIVGDIEQKYMDIIKNKCVDGTITHLSKKSTSIFSLMSAAFDMMNHRNKNTMLVLARPDTLTNWYNMKAKFTDIMRTTPFPCIIVSDDSDCDGQRLAEIASLSGGSYFAGGISSVDIRPELFCKPRFTIMVHDGARVRNRQMKVIKNNKIFECTRSSLMLNICIRKVEEGVQSIFTISGEISAEFSILRKSQIVSNPAFNIFAQQSAALSAIKNIIRSAEKSIDIVLSEDDYGVFDPKVREAYDAAAKYSVGRNKIYEIYSQLQMQ